MLSGPRHALRLLRYGIRYTVIPRLAWAFGFTRSNRQTVFVWPKSAIPLGPRVAVFCHFDRAGDVRAHVLHYLRSLSAEGFSVVFVTNSGRLKPEKLDHLQELCAGVLIRRNVGYDFGAWREALEYLKLPRPKT